MLSTTNSSLAGTSSGTGRKPAKQAHTDSLAENLFRTISILQDEVETKEKLIRLLYDKIDVLESATKHRSNVTVIRLKPK